MNQKAIIGMVLIVAVAGGAGVGGFLAKSSPTDGSVPTVVQPDATAQSATEAKEIELTAVELFRAYQSNEVSADSAYKGKQLAVTGTVESVRKDVLDNVIVNLESSNRILPVRSAMAKNFEGDAKSLMPGYRVILICDGDGMILGTPMLKRCFLSPEVPEQDYPLGKASIR